MRKMASLLASALMLGGVAVVSPAAWAHGEAHGDDLTVFAKVTDFEKTDKGEEGPSEGDELTFAADLFDEHWSDAGTSEGNCILTEVERQEREFAAKCKIGFDLEGGDVQAAGEVTDDDFEHHHMFTLPIRGGTGDYEDAEGEVTIERLSGHHHDHGHGHSGYQATAHEHDHDHLFKVTFDFHD